MKLDSKLFDNIRIKPRREEKVRPSVPGCAWEGCDQPGEFRAPKGTSGTTTTPSTSSPA
jgi:hypothetical protein